MSTTQAVYSDVPSLSRRAMQCVTATWLEYTLAMKYTAEIISCRTTTAVSMIYGGSPVLLNAQKSNIYRRRLKTNYTQRGGHSQAG